MNQALQATGRPVIAMADAGVSSSNSQWLAARKRKDKKSMFHSLPQQGVGLR